MTRVPVGIFDSGIGGLTVAKAITTAIPNVDLLYFGDTTHFPYGDKSADAIRYFSLQISKFLIEKGCKIIIVACNSASAAAYNLLTDFYKSEDVIFINVVDPLVNEVAKLKYESVGVIATKVTIASQIYQHKLKALTQVKAVHALATPLLAPMIEEGYVQNKISNAVLDNYLSDVAFKDIDVLLLACTHYPLIKEEVRSVLHNNIEVLDSTDVVSEVVKEALLTLGHTFDDTTGSRQFYASDVVDSFFKTTELFYKAEIQFEKISIWNH